MRMSEKGVLALMEFEGVVLVPYQDSAKVWTIGVGHTAAAGAPDPKGAGAIDFDTAMTIFKRDLDKYEKQVASAVYKAKPLQHEFDALVSFHFNTGAVRQVQDPKTKKWRWKASLVAHFLAGNKARAAAGFINWTRAGTNKTALLSRRLHERAMFENANYGEPFLVSVWSKWPGKPRVMKF